MLSGKLAVALGLTLLLGTSASAQIDSYCHRKVLSSLLKFKKTYLKLQAKCLNADNDDGVPDVGPCPAPVALKLQAVRDRTAAYIGAHCTKADLVAAGFAENCEYGPSSAGAEGACFALPVVDDVNDPTRFPSDVAKCLMCWKEISLARFIAIMYASQAVGVCGGTVDASSSVCADVGCTTPLPDQHDLTNQDTRLCQKTIAKTGLKVFLLREKVLEKCAIKGLSKPDCLAKYGSKFADVATGANATVNAKCGNQLPEPNPTFCCQCGTGNACNVHTNRQDCSDDPAGCQVVEGKQCVSGSCSPLPGPDKKITWWGSCPDDATCSTSVTTLDDLTSCTFATADGIVDGMVCMQVRQPTYCSASGAFLDDGVW